VTEQQIAQTLDHGARLLRLGLHLRRDGVECIEEKMGVQLHTQSVKARFRELRSILATCNSLAR